MDENEWTVRCCCGTQYTNKDVCMIHPICVNTQNNAFVDVFAYCPSCRHFILDNAVRIENDAYLHLSVISAKMIKKHLRYDLVEDYTVDGIIEHIDELYGKVSIFERYVFRDIFCQYINTITRWFPQVIIDHICEYI